MTELGALFTGDLSSLILITLILVIISIVLSLISLVLVRSSIKKATPPPSRRVEEAVAPAPPKTVKPRTAPKKEVEKVVKPPPRERGEKAKSTLIGEELGITSLEDLASMVGIKSILLFNEAGIPIESYNVSDEEKVAASAADFISLVRKLNPGFTSMTSENGSRVMLFSVEKVGEIEVFALAVSEAEAELGAEEIRDFLRAYLLESLGRYR